MIGFVEPLEVAFPTITFGIFMVAMALLGGKGTLWGPVLGAILFHVVKEVTWTYLLGWQWVALGAIIVVNIVRSAEHPSELQSLMRTSYAVFCFKKKSTTTNHITKIKSKIYSNH